MKRGEIRWYKFAHPDKQRPVLILTRNSVLEYLGEATVAPITTTIRNIPSEVFLTKIDGMPRDCAVNCDHLQTVSKGKIGSLITSLPPSRMAQVGRAICFALDISDLKRTASAGEDVLGIPRC
jgi:mRNA interferase MazF